MGARVIPVTAGRAGAQRIVVPRAATNHTPPPRIRALRVNYVILWIFSEPVFTPLPDVAVHIVESPFVRWKAAYRRGLSPIHAYLAISIYAFAIEICLVRRDCCPKVEGCRRPSTTSIFPLGFGWQSILLLVFFPQFLHERLAIIPGNVFHRQVLFTLEMAGVVTHHSLPLFLGDEMNPHVESLRQRDFVLVFVRPHVWLSTFFFLRTAHQECARRYPSELHADAVREILRRVFRLSLDGDIWRTAKVLLHAIVGQMPENIRETHSIVWHNFCDRP